MVIVISGPSGVGKSTIVRRLLKRLNFLRLSVSATTRPPRPNEKDGIDYHFITKEKFKRLIKEGKMLEWTEVYNHLYGTPTEEIEKAEQKKKTLLLDVEIEGVKQLRAKGIEGLYIQIVPPSMKELERRLKERGTENEEDLRIRLKRARKELTHSNLFDQIVVNDDLEKTVEELERLIRRVAEHEPNA